MSTKNQISQVQLNALEYSHFKLSFYSQFFNEIHTKNSKSERGHIMNQVSENMHHEFGIKKLLNWRIIVGYWLLLSASEIGAEKKKRKTNFSVFTKEVNMFYF